MLNRFLGYAVLVPLLLGIIALLTAAWNLDVLKLIDEQMYFAIYILASVSCLVGLIKLWWVPNRIKQWLPIKNRPFIFISIAIATFCAIVTDYELGDQLQMLSGIFAFVMFFTIGFRLITAPKSIDEVEAIDWKQELLILTKVFIGILLLLVALVLMSPEKKESDKSTPEESTSEIIGKPLTEYELVNHTKEFILIYKNLYYISQDDSPATDTDTAFILALLRESMNDKNKLERLLLDVKPLSENENLFISATGMSLYAGISSLITTHNNFIQYLRNVTASNVDMAEFQYQYSLFSSESKKAFFTIAEGSTSFNMALLDTEKQTADFIPLLLGESSRQEILQEIEMQLGQELIDHEKYRLETGNVDTSIFIVQNWKKTLEDMGPVEKP